MRHFHIPLEFFAEFGNAARFGNFRVSRGAYFIGQGLDRIQQSLVADRTIANPVAGPAAGAINRGRQRDQPGVRLALCFKHLQFRAEHFARAIHRHDRLPFIWSKSGTSDRCAMCPVVHSHENTWGVIAHIQYSGAIIYGLRSGPGWRFALNGAGRVFQPGARTRIKHRR